MESERALVTYSAKIAEGYSHNKRAIKAKHAFAWVSIVLIAAVLIAVSADRMLSYGQVDAMKKFLRRLRYWIALAFSDPEISKYDEDRESVRYDPDAPIKMIPR